MVMSKPWYPRYPSHSWLWMALPQNMIIKFDPTPYL